MKAHKLLLLILALTVANKTKGQDEVRFGINTGVTYSDIRGNVEAEIYNYDFGLLAGITIEYALRKKMSFKTSINFERQRFSWSYDDLLNPVDPLYAGPFYRIYDYLTVPILLNLYLGRDNNFFIKGGSYFGYLLNSEARVDGILLEDLNSSISKFSFGLSIGIGTSIRLSDRNNLTIEIVDNLGLINEKTNSINFSVGWNYKL